MKHWQKPIVALGLSFWWLTSCATSISPQETIEVTITPSSTAFLPPQASPNKISVTRASSGTIAPTDFPTPTKTAAPIPSVTPRWEPTLTPVSIATVPSLEKMGELNHAAGYLLSLSPDGRLLATSLLSDIGNTVDVFDLDNGNLVWSFEKPADANSSGILGTESLAFSPDGLLLAAGGFEQVIYIWDLEMGELVYQFPIPNYINTVDFSADGHFLAAATSHEEGIVRVWSLSDGSWFEFPTSIPALDLDFAPDRFVLAIAQDYLLPYFEGDGSVLLWNLESGDLERIFPEQSVEVVAFSPDGQTLAASVEKHLRLWDLESNMEIGVEEAILGPGRTRIVFSHKGAIATVSLGENSEIKVWNTEGYLLAQMEVERIEDIAFTLDGDLLLAQFDEPIQMWQIPSPAPEVVHWPRQ